MKHRDLITPLLNPEAYIHLARVNAQLKPKRPSLWKRFAALFKGKGSSGGAWLALFLVACSPRPEPSAHESLVWVQPKQNDKPKAGTLPRFEF